jgi:hypothetical protein
MHPIHDMMRKKRRHGGAVEGRGAKVRMDRPKRAAGGSVREDFNAAVNDQPARPTIRESGPVPAVHNRAADADESYKMDEPKKGWVDGQPRAKGGRLTAGERQALPKSDFAEPGKGKGPKGAGSGSYPIPDAKHGRLALAMVARHGSAAEKAEVRRKVHAKYPDID